MARPFVPALLALALLASACARHALVEPDRIGPGYSAGGGEWTTGGGITVMTRAVDRNGVTVICGAWATDQQSALSVFFNDDVIETGSIYLGGSRAVQNLSYMPRLQYRADLTGQPAACAASRLPWRAEYAATAPQVRLAPLRFVIDTRSSDVVRFRPGPRPSLLP